MSPSGAGSIRATEARTVSRLPSSGTAEGIGRLRRMSTDAATQKWICESCGLIYDPAEGDPDGDVPPGTPFEDIPEDWYCPVCGARKQDFVPYEE